MTLIDYIPIIDDKIVWEIKQNFYLNYSFLISKEIKEQNPETIDVLVIPNTEYNTSEIKRQQSRYEYEYWKKLTVIWCYSIDGIFENKKREIKFDFWGIGYININSNYFNYEVVDPYKFHLKKVQDLKLNVIEELNIPSLINYKSDYLKEGLTSKFLEVCKETTLSKDFETSYFLNDLEFLSHDLCFILAELTLFQPYLRSFLENPIHIEEIVVYTYYPSFYDKQYFYLASNFLQTLYNFWERLGKLIYYFFDFPKIKTEKDIYFDRIITHFPEIYKNEEFKFLYNFNENEFKKFNNERKNIVHYQGIETTLFNNYDENNSNREKMEQLQNWKINLINDFLNLREKSFKGIESVLKLIENKTLVNQNL